MIVTELRFILLVAACWASFFGVPGRYRPHALTFWGIVFYGLYAGRYLPLIVALVLGVHLLSRPRSAWMAIGGVAALLGYFKFGVVNSGVAAMGVR